jgi:hypothetical protein
MAEACGVALTEVTQNEMSVLRGLKFQLSVFLPLKPLQVPASPSAPTAIHPYGSFVLVQALFQDLCQFASLGIPPPV